MQYPALAGPDRHQRDRAASGLLLVLRSTSGGPLARRGRFLEIVGERAV